MSFQSTSCSECRGQMKAGFLLDKAHHDFVRTDRCSSCGYLESYANAG